jgi:hypothetical protein
MDHTSAYSLFPLIPMYIFVRYFFFSSLMTYMSVLGVKKVNLLGSKNTNIVLTNVINRS